MRAACATDPKWRNQTDGTSQRSFSNTPRTRPASKSPIPVEDERRCGVGTVDSVHAGRDARRRGTGGATMIDLEKAIIERHSTRMFLPHQPVPRELVDEALRL